MSGAPYKIFISSVQKELAEERRAVKNFIIHDPLLSRFIPDVFLFEDIPAKDRKPDDIYLDQVERCDIYLGIFGNRYGWKNEDGKSPTELEFEHATATRRERLIFIKGDDDKAREPEMAKLVSKAGRQLTRRRFSDTPALIREVYASLVECLENRGDFRSRPFDDSLCDGATLRDVDDAAVADFVETAETAGRLKGPAPRKRFFGISTCFETAAPRMLPCFCSGRIPAGFSTISRSTASISMERKSGNPSRPSSPMTDG